MQYDQDKVEDITLALLWLTSFKDPGGVRAWKGQDWDTMERLHTKGFLLLDGKIVLGSDHDAVTFLHYVEHIVDIPGKRIARYQVPVMENGCRVWRAIEEFDTSGDGAHTNWPDRFFAKIVDSLLLKTENNGALVGNAMTHILSARELLDFALPVMEAVAADQLPARSLRERDDHS
jgi:aminoglycoside 3-N-acetyltransferase